MRSLALMLAGFACAGAAFGADPGAVPDPWEYNNALVDASNEAIQRVRDAERELSYLPPVAHFEAWRQAASAAMRQGRAEVERIEERPFDQGFRAAVLESFDVADHVFTVSFPEVFLIQNKEHVVNADLAQLEALWREIHREIDRVDQQVRDKQRAYVRAAGGRVRETPEPPPVDAGPPDFAAPGIPPAGSLLPGQVHVSFAVRYRNEAIDLQNVLSSSANAVVGALNELPSELEAVRKEQLGEVRSIRKRAEQMEPWQGDATLRDGLVAMAKQLEGSLGGPVRDFAKLLKNGIESQRDADRANALVGEMNEAIRAAHEQFHAVDERFEARWMPPSFAAWQKDRDDREAHERAAPPPPKPHDDRPRPPPPPEPGAPV
jgi:hypothetical protein